MLRRIGLAASKYWVCKRATPHAAEALECLGGNGYVEESGHAAAVPRGAADGHLGRLGQCQRAGYVARHGNSSRVRRGAVRRTGRERGPGRPAGQPRREPAAATGRSRRPSSTAPARSPRTSAWRCRGRCWCATGTPRSPRRSWPPGSTGSGAGRSAPCRPGWTSRPSSSGPGKGHEPQHDSRDQAGRLRQPENDDLRGHRSGCADHLQSAGEGQRDRRGHSAGAVGIGGARRPGPQRARHPGVRSRRRVSARAST